MMKKRTVAIVFVLLVLSICLAGCGDKFWDPTQIGRFRPVPAVNVILDSLGVADETPSVWEGAEEPRPADIMAYETDYVLGRGDTVRISIFELLQEGVPFVYDYVVTETGKISIPEVGIVNAEGLTESQLEEEIKRILAPGVLREPSVTVTLLESQQRTFSIWGNAVTVPGRYAIPRYDFRLTDVLATARVAIQFNVSSIYVTRPVTGREAISEPSGGEVAPPREVEQIESGREMLEIISPRAQKQSSGNDVVMASSEMVTDKELSDTALPEGFESLSDGNQMKTRHKDISSAPTKLSVSGLQGEPIENVVGRIEWVFQDGKWLPVQIGQPGTEAVSPPVEPGKGKTSAEAVGGQTAKEMPQENFTWDQIGTGGVQTRLIKISTDRLSSGDPRYNIVIRPGDSIQVPLDIIGGFYMMGNTNNQGFIELTGRPMTLKMAIAAAGGLGPLAWPKHCEVIRRIGRNKEETVMMDLDKIACGAQPDFFIKPNDVVNVGTHPTARWRAVLRNAFRATYGFGFIYDRNFADRDFGTSRPIPNFLF